MRQFFYFVTSHPIVVLSIAAVVALGLASQILLLESNTSPDAFIPPGHPALALKKEVEDSFGLREPFALGVIRDGPGGFLLPDSVRLIQRLTERIEDLPGVEPGDVLSLASESGIYFEDGEPGFERLMPKVPATAAQIDALKRDVFSYELYRGTLVAEDGSAACILIRPKSEQQADELYRQLQALLEDFPTGDEELVVAGEAAVRAHMGAAVSQDALRMNFICPAVMFLLIVLAYRTPRGMVLPMCVIGGASAMALGLMSLSGVPVYIVTNGIFVVIMAVGVADSLHLVGQYYEEQLHLDGRTRQQLIVDACMALWYPVLITSATDVAGFFSLYLVGIMPPIRYFGLFTCAGVIGALIYSYTVIPAGLAVLPLKTSGAFVRSRGTAGEVRAVDATGRMLGRLGSFAFRRWRMVLLLTAVLIAVVAFGASKLIINDARILAFKDHHPIVRAANILNERFDGTSHLNIVITASKKDAMLQPEVLHKIEQLERYSESLAYVGGTHSVAGWVKRAHQKMHEDDPAYYAIPDDTEETRYYLDVLSAPTSPMADLLGEVVDKSYSRANLTLRMKSSQYIHQRPVIELLQAYLDEHFSAGGPLRAELAGRVNLDYHWLRIIRTSHIRSVSFAFLCVLLLTGLMFRSAVAGLLCTATVGMAVVTIYAIMGFSDIPLGVGTSMFASIAIGAGVNFPIHILDRLRVEMADSPGNDADVFRDAFTFTGRALFFTAGVVSIGFLLLCVSEFQTLVRFGLLISVGMLVSFLTSVTLLPAVLAALRPRFLWGRSVPGAKRP
ncbi:MAG: MMPL family transporter [Thermoguttaceae bacterium]